MMDFGVVFSPLPGPSVGATRPFSDWMRAAETVCTTLTRAGFSSIVFTHSYQYGGMQPLVTMARLAPAADPLRMATQVLLLPLLNAADVAYNVVTLDHICTGRLDLGIGLAYHLKEVPLGGITRQERVPKFVEALEVMKQFWTGEEVHHEGQYFTVHGTRMGLRPYQQPHPPLWIAAHSHGAAARAGQLGDGVIIGPQIGTGCAETYLIVGARLRENLFSAGCKNICINTRKFVFFGRNGCSSRRFQGGAANGFRLLFCHGSLPRLNRAPEAPLYLLPT